jgi:hypothetical protein
MQRRRGGAMAAGHREPRAFSRQCLANDSRSNDTTAGVLRRRS